MSTTTPTTTTPAPNAGLRERTPRVASQALSASSVTATKSSAHKASRGAAKGGAAVGRLRWWWQRWWEVLQGWWLLVASRWLRRNKRHADAPAPPQPTSDTFHKILCLGDGTVEGWGDVWRVGQAQAGFPVRLQELLDETDKVRQRWLVLNYGHYGASSDDWLPDTTRKPKVGSRWVKRTLWKDAMDDPAVRDSEIVLLSLGAMDNLYGVDGTSASHTVKNLIRICKALKRMHKLVFVAPIPAGREEDKGHKRRNLERNALLWEFLEEQEGLISDSSQEPKGAIYAGPGWRGRHTRMMYATDMIHFNSSGYQMRAEEWGNCLLQPMLRIEWRCWQKLIKTRSSPPTSKKHA